MTADGAPGLIKAVVAIRPEAERIRCWVHKMRNVPEKVPEEARPALKSHLQFLRDAPDYETGRRLADQVVVRFEGSYPSVHAGPDRRP